MNTQDIRVEEIVAQNEAVETTETTETTLNIQTGVKAGYGGYGLLDAVNPVTMYYNMKEAMGY